MKKLFLFFCLSTIFLLSCQDNKWEDKIIRENLLSYNGPNKVGKYLVKKLEKQSDIRTKSEMMINNQEKVLFDYTEFGIGSAYGLHYIIPVINEITGYVSKAIIYQIDEDLAQDSIRLDGDITSIIILDKNELDAIPASKRFVYSYFFKKWENKGLKVASTMSEFAQELDGKLVALKNTERSIESRTPNSNRTFRVDYWVECSNYVDDNDGLIVPQISLRGREDVFHGHLSMLANLMECALELDVSLTILNFRVTGGICPSNNEIRAHVEDYMRSCDSDFRSRFFWYDNMTWQFTASSTGGDESGGSGSGSETGGGSTNPGGSGEIIKANVELSDQTKFVGYDSTHNCWVGCTLIMQNYAVAPGSSAHVYRLLIETNGQLVHYGNDAQNNHSRAIACINRHLDANRPIIVGVNHTIGKNINEGTTDHFIVITGRGYDTINNQYYYTYMDTGRTQANAAAACSTIENRLYYNSTDLTFRDSTAGASKDKIYDITQVRPNDGLYLNETISL